MIKKQVYLDHAATTQVHPKVFEKMIPYLKDSFGNPSSQHSFGRKIRVAIEESREIIAGFINAKPGEIYFMSGGTESNNFVLNGIIRTNLTETGRIKILSSAAEHHCVLDTLDALSKEGLRICLIPVDNNGILSYPDLQNNLDAEVSLVSAIHVNNETGSFNRIKDIAQSAHKQGSYFHSDAVQSFGKTPIDVKDLNVDAFSFSSHKIGGPKGAGAAYIKSGTPVSPLIFGGSQERNRRGGTENVPGIIGFAEAVRIAGQEMNDNQSKIKSLNEYFRKGIADIDSEGIMINSPSDALENIVSITFAPSHYITDPEALLMYLDINGIAASNGSACTSGTVKSSHVILAMGKSLEYSQGTIRFSLGRQNTLSEIDYTIDVLRNMSDKFRK